MKNAYIKFRTTEDRILGCEALMAHSRVSLLSNDVYCIPWGSLALLEAREIEYHFANQDDLTNARPIWKFAAVGV